MFNFSVTAQDPGGSDIQHLEIQYLSPSGGGFLLLECHGTLGANATCAKQKEAGQYPLDWPGTWTFRLIEAYDKWGNRAIYYADGSLVIMDGSFNIVSSSTHNWNLPDIEYDP
jgi:hypothetical protein